MLVSSENVMYIHNNYIIVAWVRRWKCEEILKKNLAVRLSGSTICRFNIDCIKSIDLNIHYFVAFSKIRKIEKFEKILFLKIIFCSIFFMFKMKLSVEIRT